MCMCVYFIKENHVFMLKHMIKQRRGYWRYGGRVNNCTSEVPEKASIMEFGVKVGGLSFGPSIIARAHQYQQ